MIAPQPGILVNETEDQLIEMAQQALSQCRWVVGECAGKWTKRYAKNRTDADFGNLIGLTGDQVYQRRRVWETFADVRDEYKELAWSHFYAALTWDDAAESLQWADETASTVAEMKAWRRAARGEDLTEPAVESSSEFVQAFAPETAMVQDPADFQAGKSRGASKKDRDNEDARVAGVARDVSSGDDYSPFRSGAMQVPGGATAVAEATETAEDMSADQLAKRICTTLERCTKAMTAKFLKAVPDLPEKTRARLKAAVAEILPKLQEMDA